MVFSFAAWDGVSAIPSFWVCVQPVESSMGGFLPHSVSVLAHSRTKSSNKANWAPLVSAAE